MSESKDDASVTQSPQQWLHGFRTTALSYRSSSFAFHILGIRS